MTDCKNCKYTDEYCASGDCTAQLNKQWYEGTLKKDKYYYAKDSSEGDCIVHINKSNEMTFTGWEVPYKPDQSNILEPFKLKTELLERVPSYEEWQQLKEYERIVTSYNMKPIDYDIACETVNKLLDEKKALKEQNKQLKELLKECCYRIDWRTKTGDKSSDDEKQKLFDEIDQVLRS